MPTRIRSTDELSRASMNGQSYDPDIPRVYTNVNRCLGEKKVTVDTVGHTVDYRYFMIPTYKTIVSKYKGKDPKKKGSKTYLRHINLKRPGKPKASPFIKLNNFSVSSFRGYSAPVTLSTLGSLPKGWTNWVLVGPLAAFVYDSVESNSSWGLDPTDLSRPLPLDQSYVDAVLQRAMGKVSCPDVDFAEIVGEFHQLVRLVHSPFKALSDMLRKFQRLYSSDTWVFTPRKGLVSFRTRRKVGRMRVAKQVIEEASSRWLEYRYGLMPAILDAQEIMKKFSEKIARLSEIRFKKAKIVTQATSRTWEEDRNVFLGFNVRFRSTLRVRDVYTCKVYYNYKYTNAAESVDLGLNNVTMPQSAWELTPWSFVVDWFYGVGDWIRSFNTDPAVWILGNYVTRKRDMWLRVQVISINYYGIPLKVPFSTAYFHYAAMTRVVNQPVPELPVFNPDFLKWRRVLDSLSLIWGRFPSLRR